MIAKKWCAFLLLFFLPFVSAATLKGLVVDKDTLLVRGASLRFDCGQLPEDLPVETDSFGSFRVENFPVGECDVFAHYDNYVGYVTVHLEEDDFERVIIHLDQKIVKKDYSLLFLILLGVGFLLLLLSIILLIIWFVKRKDTREMKRIERQTIASFVSIPHKGQTRLDTISVTFSKPEKAVVDYLLSHHHEAVQADMRHAMHLARTTLARVLEGLERKKVVSIEKLGKAIKVKLSDWILENR